VAGRLIGRDLEGSGLGLTEILSPAFYLNNVLLSFFKGRNKN
jgi:hypothetical protein